MCVYTYVTALPSVDYSWYHYSHLLATSGFCGCVYRGIIANGIRPTSMSILLDSVEQWRSVVLVMYVGRSRSNSEFTAHHRLLITVRIISMARRY